MSEATQNQNGTSTPPPAATTTNGDQSGPSWTAGLSDDHKGWLENKGFADINTMTESYRSIEKLLGGPKEKLLRLPDKDDAPEWGDVYKRLGKPEKAEEYKLDGMSDEEFKKFSQSKFHELGLTKKQAEGIASAWKEYSDKGETASAQEMAQKAEQEEIALKKEWGAAFEQNRNIAGRGMTVAGMTPEMVNQIEDALGFAATMKLLHTFGSKLGEGEFIAGSPGNPNVLTPGAALHRIKELQQDTGFIQKLASGDMDAKKEMDRLHQQAYPTNS